MSKLTSILVLVCVALSARVSLSDEIAKPSADASVGSVKNNISSLHDTMYSVPAGNMETAESQASLDDMIRKLENLRVPKPDPSGEIVLKKPEKKKEPTVQTDTVRKAEVSPKELSGEVLKMLGKGRGNNLTDPIFVANGMYEAGDHGVAEVFYRKAVSTEKDPARLAWAMYQLGNCVSKSDPVQAQKYYAEVMAKHPKTIWAELSRTKKDMLVWEARTEIPKLLQRVRDNSAVQDRQFKKDAESVQAKASGIQGKNL